MFIISVSTYDRLLDRYCSLFFFENSKNIGKWRLDIQHDDTEHTDIPHNDNHIKGLFMTHIIHDTQHNNTA